MEEKEVQYVTVGKLVSGLSVALVLLMGWLFNVIASSTKDIQAKQSTASVRSAVNNARIDRLDDIETMRRGRVSSLEKITSKNSSEIENIKYTIHKND